MMLKRLIFRLGMLRGRVGGFDITRGKHHGVPPSTPPSEMTVEQLKSTDWYWSASPGLRDRLENSVREAQNG